VKRTVLLALLLACGTAQASEWVSLGKSEDGTKETFIDVSSIRVVGAIRRAWFKVIYAPHAQRGSGSDANKWWNYTMEREALTCAEETFRLEGLLIYYDDGTTNSVPSISFPTSWEPVPPDTMYEVQLRFICTWKPK
jgi:hypothetical protein